MMDTIRVVGIEDVTFKKVIKVAENNTGRKTIFKTGLWERIQLNDASVWWQ